MSISYSVYGNCIMCTIKSNMPLTELVLPAGYSYHKILYIASAGYIQLPHAQRPLSGDRTYTFPIVNGKSPNSIMVANPGSSSGTLTIVIESFGGEPDNNYFNKIFDPILVKRKDGTTYKMIPTRDKGGV